MGPQRIAHEIGLRDIESSPSRSSVHRVLVRHGFVAAQQQNHKRKYRRWQRDAAVVARHHGRGISGRWR